MPALSRRERRERTNEVRVVERVRLIKVKINK